MAKMHTGLVDAHHTQELAKLTSAVVPLQRLKIQDDTFMEVPKSKLETEVPAPPKNKQKTDICIKIGKNHFNLTNLQ